MAEPNTDTLYRALTARDPRYDGRFYFGVTTTGIYCRPICSARPHREHILIFKSKAEAEKAGYRPCLRCRPDLSPGSVQWRGTEAVVTRALGMINRGEADEVSLAALADRLGISDRHLRRLFREQLGASPVEIAISRRLHLARQLLSETLLSITEIALASGFNSLRRFNDAFSTTYQVPPSRFRAQQACERQATDTITLRLPYCAPYDWDTMIRYFARHQVHGVDAVENSSYLRQFKGAQGESLIRVEHLEREHALRLSLRVEDFRQLRPLIEQVRTVFDLEHNPQQIELPGCTAGLAEAVGTPGGLRIPGSFDALETAVTIILGQLVSTDQARLNVRKLVEAWGDPSRAGLHPGLSHFFPAAEVLAREDLSTLGFTRVRAGAIRELARAHLGGELDLSRSCDLQATRTRLLQIKGIGPWSAELIALRCLGDPDAFPGSDLVLKRAAAAGDCQPENFSPWRGYLAFALWKQATSGTGPSTTGPSRTAPAATTMKGVTDETAPL
jgi:AraC family transcriptional regulator, regulatory protein of adaptative response / DNA-3-methyladenine glycosylase II